MAALQLTFTLRTTPNAKTVHLVGNWDGYKGQLPMSRESKAGAWRGTFRFQQSTLTPGKRYWYYYIMDGYQVSHDPAKPSTREPTTGRQLNILDVPKVSGLSSSSSSSSSSSKISTSRPLLPSQAARQGLGIQIPTGRGISPSRIISPKPSKPYASRAIREADYSRSPVDELSSRLSHSRIFAADEDDYPSSPSATSSLSSRSGGSSPSSLSSLSDRSASSCRCNRFGITRRGDKVRLDCGGSRCAYSDDSSSCCSDESEDERPRLPSRATRSSATSSAPVIKPRVQEIRPRGSATSSSRRR